MFKGLFLLLLRIYMFVLCDIIELSNERGASCMKLTNNLTVEQAFKAYPYNVILEEFTESWYHSTVNTFKRVYEKGWDLRHVLLEIEKFCQKYQKASNITLLIFYHNVYAECMKHDLPDPSHVIPVDLSEARRHYVIKGYQEGIDASIYANNKMPATHVKEMKEALILLKNLDQWNKHTSKTMKVEFIDK